MTAEQIAAKRDADREAYWANRRKKKSAGDVTIIMCFSCKLRPGVKGWQGYFVKDAGGKVYRHMECPKRHPESAS